MTRRRQAKKKERKRDGGKCKENALNLAMREKVKIRVRAEENLESHVEAEKRKGFELEKKKSFTRRNKSI